MKNVNAQVQLPRGYHIDWEGEYESEKRAQARLFLIVPITVLVIFLILYTMFRSAKWALLILATVAMASFGGLLALLITGTDFSVSSGVGFLALFGVSVQTGVIMLEYINQLPRPRPFHRGFGHRRRRPAAAPHHDDHARRHAGTAARGAVPRHWLGFAAALRDRHRRRPDRQFGHEHLSCCPPSTSGWPDPTTNSRSRKSPSDVKLKLGVSYSLQICSNRLFLVSTPGNRRSQELALNGSCPRGTICRFEKLVVARQKLAALLAILLAFLWASRPALRAGRWPRWRCGLALHRALCRNFRCPARCSAEEPSAAARPVQPGQAPPAPRTPSRLTPTPQGMPAPRSPPAPLRQRPRAFLAYLSSPGYFPFSSLAGSTFPQDSDAATLTKPAKQYPVSPNVGKWGGEAVAARRSCRRLASPLAQNGYRYVTEEKTRKAIDGRPGAAIGPP